MKINYPRYIFFNILFCIILVISFNDAVFYFKVNTLQQLQNIASYGMLKKRLEKHDLHIHALWFDIYTGDIYYFSRRAKRFLIIDESSYEIILGEIRRYYS